MTTIKTTKALTLRNSDTGKLTSLFAGQIVSVDDALATQLISDGLAIVFSSIVPANTLDISKNGTYDVTLYASASVNVPRNLDLNVVPVIDNEIDLLGKTVNELQDNIAISSAANVTGNLLYVDDYTGFSGDVDLQKGHFLAIKCTAVDDSVITVELIGGSTGHPVTLDDDGIIILRISNLETQSIEVVATNGNVKEIKTLTISDLVLQEA